MKRYFSIYRSLIAINWSSLVIYRTNFVTSIVASFSWAVFSIISIILITYRTPVIYGVKREDLMMMTALYSIFIGVFHTIFSRNFDRFSHLMYYGELDQILTKPVDTQFLVSVWLVNFASIIRIIVGIIFAGILLVIQQRSIGVLQIIMSILALCIGLVFLYTLWIMAATLTIWFPRLSNIIEFMYSVSNLARYPKNMFKQVSEIVFSFLLPLTMLMFVPMNALAGRSTIADIMFLVFIFIVTLLASRIFWTYSLRHYASASS